MGAALSEKSQELVELVRQLRDLGASEFQYEGVSVKLLSPAERACGETADRLDELVRKTKSKSAERLDIEAMLTAAIDSNAPKAEIDRLRQMLAAVDKHELTPELEGLLYGHSV